MTTKKTNDDLGALVQEAFDNRQPLPIRDDLPPGNLTAEAERQMPRDWRLDQAHAALVEGTPLELKISGGMRRVFPHPLASTFPVISRQELAELVADIEANGLRQPVALVGQSANGWAVLKGRDVKVLEGRSRLAALWVLGEDVYNSSYRMFDGTEDEAISFVVSANILRRHLNPVQRALLVRRFFLPAELEASATRKGGRPKAGESKKPKEGGDAVPSVSGKAVDRAAARAGGLVSGRTVHDLAILDVAERTARKAMAGKFSSVPEAVRAAEKELGKDGKPSTRKKPKATPGSKSLPKNGSEASISDLAQAAEFDLNQLVHRLGKVGNVERVVPKHHRTRIARLRAVLDRWEVLLDARESAS